MNSFSIAYKNVRRKFNSYLIFFFSTTFSVVIFNLFCSMYYNPSFETFRFGGGKMSTLFKGTAVAVLLFASVFVLYSGNYFIKLQKKQIAIYSLLGMRKVRIAFLMFLETFLIGLLAVGLGSLIGTCSAGYFTSLLMRFMAVGTKVTLTMEPRAILITILAFMILFFISGIRSYFTIYRYTLLDLLSASKQIEKVPGFSRIGAVASVVLLVAGYVLSAKMNLNDFGLQLLLPSFIIILCVSIGTFLLFRNLFPLALKLFKKNRPLYFRTSSFISISQIAFRLKANSGMLAVVAILCAVTTTMLSASYSLYNGLEDGTDYYAPFSYMVNNITEEQHAQILDTVAEMKEVNITKEDKIELIRIQAQQDNYTLEESGNEPAEPGRMFHCYLLSESSYLKIIEDTAAVKDGETNLSAVFRGKLKNNECFFLDGNVTAQYSESMVGENINVTFKDRETAYQVSGISLHKYLGLLDLYRMPTLVVSNCVYDSYKETAHYEDLNTFYGFMFDDEMNSLATVQACDSFIPARFFNGGLPSNVSYIGIYRANFALYGSYVFIGLFIGILFMLAVGSIMFYKLIMEAQEEAPRYGILRKTGMKKQEILSSVMKLLGITYVSPFAIGLLHTVFALLTYNRMLDLMGQETPTLQNAGLVVLIFVAIYALFYALSVRFYYKAVKG